MGGTLAKLEAIREGKLSAVENVRRALGRIEKLDRKINAFIELNPNALAEAEAVDRAIERGEAGKLAGLTIGVKSNVNVLGLRATCASRTLENYVSAYDAEVIRRIRKAGGIVIGMTNMDEFACGSSGETSAFGPTDNPAAPGHIPGGSSSGAAAAIAAGFCDLCLGTDTGGSIRNPASHCGVVGLKPTYGLVPRQGLIDLGMSLDQIGPLAPDVYGAALLLEVIAGRNPNECVMLDAPSLSYVEGLKGEGLEGLRVGVSPKFAELTEPEIVEVIDEAIGRLGELGAELVEVELPNLERGLPAYYLIVSVEFFSATRKFDGRKYGRRIEEVCGDEVLRRILRGRYISRKEYRGKYYQRALQVRTLIKHEFEEALKRVDVIVGPTVPKLPHKLGTKLTPMEMYAYDYLTVPANLAGICGGVIKAGEAKGIPVGLQVQSGVLKEPEVLKVMRALEEAA